MSETDLVGTEADFAPRKRGGLTGMVLEELRQLAEELNISDTSAMRKGELIAAIKERQGGAADPPPAVGQLSLPEHGGGSAEPVTSGDVAAETSTAEAPGTEAAAANGSAPAVEAVGAPRRRVVSRPAGAPDVQPAANGVVADPAPSVDPAPADDERQVNGAPALESAADTPAQASLTDTEADTGGRRSRQNRRPRGDQPDATGESGPGETAGNDRQRGRNRGDDRGDAVRGGVRNDNRGPRDNRPDDDSDTEGDGRGRRGRRFRDRRRGRDRNDRGGGQGQAQGTVDTEVRDGDVLLPVAGIIDVLDNYAFVRTTGYLSGPTDVYVSLSVVRTYGLRRGDAITGAVREPREGEQSRQKFNPLVRVDTINGQEPEASRGRPEFTKLTPLYPNERLRLETESHKLTPRVIDLVMPIGKGQRALIVSPPKAGKTMILQSIANAITTNNPECHLMVVLVDERPEEVTDMQRSVKGEVIASTFDRPPGDHTTVAELAIERAKRLVEMGHDVVVLLDSITRLGRAYNLAAPASGRILSGGVDSTALYPPKRFLGAARNIEDGGSLTIFATALVETGSTMDTVIFEEFKGTGNAELKLDRRIADKRVFPAIDVDASGTRKEELLLSPDELAVIVKLRRVLSALDDQQAIDLLLTQLRKTRTNIEFLMQVAKSTPGSDD